MKKLFLTALFLAGWAVPAWAEPVKIVATTTFFSGIMKEIGGDKVEVKPVAPPRFNVHYIEPKPSDVRNVAKADLFVFAGLDHEAWAEPLLEAAGRPELFRGAERNLDMSRGIELLEVEEGAVSRHEGDIHVHGNPHYQMDPRNALVMARNAAEKLSQIDASNAPYYAERLAAFSEKWEAKLVEWKALASPASGEEVVSYHKDIIYFAGFMSLVSEQFVEPKPGIPPTPKHLAFLRSYMKEKSVKAIVQPSYYPLDASRVLARDTGAELVIVSQNPGETGPEDLFGFFDRNVRVVTEALK